MGRPQTRGFTLLFRPQKKKTRCLKQKTFWMCVSFLLDYQLTLTLKMGLLMQLIQLRPPLATIQLLLVPELLPKGLLSLMGSRPNTPPIHPKHTVIPSLFVYNTRIQPSHENTLQYYRSEKNGCKMQIADSNFTPTPFLSFWSATSCNFPSRVMATCHALVIPPAMGHRGPYKLKIEFWNNSIDYFFFCKAWPSSHVWKIEHQKCLAQQPHPFLESYAKPGPAAMFEK